MDEQTKKNRDLRQAIGRLHVCIANHLVRSIGIVFFSIILFAVKPILDNRIGIGGFRRAPPALAQSEFLQDRFIEFAAKLEPRQPVAHLLLTTRVMANLQHAVQDAGSTDDARALALHLAGGGTSEEKRQVAEWIGEAIPGHGKKTIQCSNVFSAQDLQNSIVEQLVEDPRSVIVLLEVDRLPDQTLLFAIEAFFEESTVTFNGETIALGQAILILTSGIGAAELRELGDVAKQPAEATKALKDGIRREWFARPAFAGRLSSSGIPFIDVDVVSEEETQVEDPSEPDTLSGAFEAS